MTTPLIETFQTVTASSSAPVAFLDAEKVLEECSWAELFEGAVARAAALQARGVERGDRIGMLGFTSREFIETIFATILAGAVVVVMPLPMRLTSEEAFLTATRLRLSTAKAKLLVLDGFFTSLYTAAPGDPDSVTMQELATGDAATFSPPAAEAEDLAILQFTSGSTADPRAVRLSHRSVHNNLFAAGSGATFGPRFGGLDTDHMVSWLPLYHDMGLISGVLLPAIAGIPASLASPQTFLGRPQMWMEMMHARRGSFTAAPNFAYALAAKAFRRSRDLDLSCVRLALCGAEPIAADAIRRWTTTGAQFGLRDDVVFCCYGMAETVVGVTFAVPGGGLTVDRVDRAALEAGEWAIPVPTRDDGSDDAGDVDHIKEVVCLGPPLRGTALRIVDTEGNDLPERGIGEVLVASTSMMQGYDGRPDATAEVLDDGWLRTGDLGYLVAGELYLCGRRKELIIVGGRNIWPQDVEAAAHGAEGIRPGNAIAFGITRDDGSEAIVLVAETRLQGDDAAATARAAADVVKDAVGLAPRHVVLIAPGQLPKTSSGKLQRGLCRTMYGAGQFSPVADHGQR